MGDRKVDGSMVSSNGMTQNLCDTRVSKKLFLGCFAPEYVFGDDQIVNPTWENS